MKADTPADGALASNSSVANHESASNENAGSGRATTGVKLVGSTLLPGGEQPTEQPRPGHPPLPSLRGVSSAPDLGKTIVHPHPAPPSVPPPGPRQGLASERPPRRSLSPPRPPPKPSDQYLGTTIDGRYAVEAVVGEGGMGVVYRCRHTIIGKKVAMKILRTDLARDREVTERFLIEAKAASTIGNEHIIDISDFGYLSEGAAYFVMEFLEGVPLSSRLEGERALPLAEILPIAQQLTDGLGAAHQRGIVHRDLKPDNIYLVKRGGQTNFVKILDFGIAKVSTSPGKLTQAGSVFGTPHYMSPEQASGQPVDHRGDIYSLGVIMHELASGKVPFDADNYMAILSQHLYKSPVPLRQLGLPATLELPVGLEALVLKCLAKRPEQRYQSMAEVRQELDKLLAGQVPQAVEEVSQSNAHGVPADYFGHGTHVVEEKKTSAPPGGFVVPARPRSHWLAGFALVFLVGVAGSLAILGWLGPRPDLLAQTPPTTTVAAVPAALSPPREPSPVVSPSTEQTDRVARSPSSLPTAPPESATGPASSGTDPVPVVIGVDPVQAHVYYGGSDLGTSPVVLNVADGKKHEVDIRLPGYHSKKVMLDSRNRRVVVKLERVSAPPALEKPPVPARKKPAAKSQVGSPEIVDPWAN